MTEDYIPTEDIPENMVSVSNLFTNGEMFRKKDALFEVISCNDSKRTVTLKFVGGFVKREEEG